jgi:hypothetical protein
MTVAKVPVSDEMATELANAGFKPEDVQADPSEMQAMLGTLIESLAGMVSSPFEIVGTLAQSAAMMPAALRAYMAVEFAISEHSVMRETVPLLLLDSDPQVRAAAAGALEKIASPGTMSPEMLRRAIVLRNWIPEASRPALDSAIRKARVAGVETAPWPACPADTEFYVSAPDGSGAESIIMTSRGGRKGFVAGVLIRLGEGIADAWGDTDVTRGKIGKLLRDAQENLPLTRTDRALPDMLLGHAIAAAIASDTPPPASLLLAAELAGGSVWRETAMDIQAEVARLYEAMPASARTEEAALSAMAEAADWMDEEEIFMSWYEDGPDIQKRLGAIADEEEEERYATVLEDILPPRRDAWTELFLVMGMWCAAATDAAATENLAFR